MYQMLDDLANIQDAQTEPSKSKGWIKWFLVGLGLIILVIIVLFIYNGNNEENNPSSSDYGIDPNFLDGNVDLEYGNAFSRLLQLEPEENDNNDIQFKNAEILSQLKDESFWKEKIEEVIKKKIDRIHEFDRQNIDVVGYGLECDEGEEDLSRCKYDVGFIYKYEVSPIYNNGIGYDSFGDSGYCGGGYHRLTYSCIVKYLAMKDIGHDKVFYKAGNDYSYWEDKYDMLDKYMGKDFEYTGDIRDVHFIQYIVLEDGAANYYKYIIDDDGNILFKDIVKFITRDEAKQIIAEDASISPKVIKYFRLNAEDETYTCDFSYNGHTYKYKIDAKNGDIIEGGNDIDIGDEKAMEIALKDSGLKATDLWKDVSHGHGMEKMLLMPEINKEGTGENAIYDIEIETEDGMVYSYQIKATDGKILLKHLSEQFVIYDKEGEKKNMVYKIKSTHKKSRNLEINPSELNMDDIYEFKDQIYLWISFDGEKIVDRSIIDRPYKHTGKMTKDELDEYYNFESHYPVKIVDKKINGEEENVYEIYLSKIDKNVIYKYTIMTGRNCSYEIINDIEKDVIVYEGIYGSEKYKAIPYLKEGYDGRGLGGCTIMEGDVHFSIMYKEASSEDLFKIIDKKEITYLSKFKVGDELNIRQRHNENYLYNDTNNDLTISVTDYGIVNAPEDFQFIVKPGKFAHCYDATDIVKIIK